MALTLIGGPLIDTLVRMSENHECYKKPDDIPQEPVCDSGTVNQTSKSNTNKSTSNGVISRAKSSTKKEKKKKPSRISHTVKVVIVIVIVLSIAAVIVAVKFCNSNR